MLLEHFKIACEPFAFERESIFSGDVERRVQHSDGIDEEKSLLSLVAQFVRQSPKYIQHEEATQARQTKLENRIRLRQEQLEKEGASEPIEELDSDMINADFDIELEML